jgi:hypothetical protein
MWIRTTTSEILHSVKVSEVYLALTGKHVKRTGGDKWRAVALWRGGDGLSVSGDDGRGVWKDFAGNEGGGMLDLVVRVRGGPRQDALRWVAELAGISLENKPQSPRERREWIQERRKLECELPQARYWRRAMVHLIGELLDSLKAKLREPLVIDLEFGEIYDLTRLLARLERIDVAELVAEFDSWMGSISVLSESLIRWAQQREATEVLAIKGYLHAGI